MDVAVVGLGSTGLAAALEARRRGATVTGYDSGAIGGGATGRNGGFIMAGVADFYHRRRNRELYGLTLDEIDRIVAETPTVISRVGSVRRPASADEREDVEKQYQALVDDGFAAERIDDGSGSILLPTDASFHPLARVRLLAMMARQQNVVLVENNPVQNFEALDADKVIVAVDGGLERVLPELTGRVRTARLQMLATTRTDEVRITRPTYSRYGYDYWQQLPDGRVILGGCRDLFPDQSWTTAAKPTQAVQRALDRVLRDEVGIANAPVTHRWAGCSSYTDNRRPICEEVRPNVVAVGAFCGQGNVVGSMAARAAVELALDGQSALAAILTT
jgi:glycine/D-amino acid oxidase-like deaminating enzyme